MKSKANGRYPVSYRAGSRPYQPPEAFKPEVGARAGIEGQPRGDFPGGWKYFTPAGTEIRADHLSAGELGRLTQLFEAARRAGIPNVPLRMAPTGNLPVAMSAGALARVGARATAIGRVVDMVQLAHQVYNHSRGMGYGMRTAPLPDASGVCNPLTGAVTQLWGLHDPFGHGTCSTTQPDEGLCFPPGMQFWPSGPVNRIVAMGNQGFNGNFNCYKYAGEWLVNEGIYADPNLTSRTTNALGLNWSGFPEMVPINRPTGFPQGIPFGEIPNIPNSDVRESGSSLPGDVKGGPPGGSQVGTGMQFPFEMPPLAGVKERKYQGRLALMIANAITESDDFLECMWKALPKKERSKIKGKKVRGDDKTIYYWHKDWGRKQGYSPEQIAAHNAVFTSKAARPVHQTPQTMISELLAHGVPTQAEVDSAVRCMAVNSLVDLAIGKANQKTNANLHKAVRDAGVSDRWLHIGTGPAL